MGAESKKKGKAHMKKAMQSGCQILGNLGPAMIQLGRGFNP